MESLIRNNISSLCKAYKLDNETYDMLTVSLEFDVKETIDFVQDIIFMNTRDRMTDIGYHLLIATTRLNTNSSIDALIKFLNKEKETKSLVEDIEDMYILLRSMRMIGFSDDIICKHFLDIYLPSTNIILPFSRDKKIKARYTSSVLDDIIYVNIPSADGNSSLEELNNTHIYLAIEQNGRK